MTFRWRVISRSNVNGKVHTFQKDFDDYESYQTFMNEHPDYAPRAYLGDWWSPWSLWDAMLPDYQAPALPADTRLLPEGVDLEKYEKRRLEKKQSEAEKIRKRHTLEKTQAYLKDYLEENPDDTEAKSDLEKVEKELEGLQ